MPTRDELFEQYRKDKYDMEVRQADERALLWSMFQAALTRASEERKEAKAAERKRTAKPVGRPHKVPEMPSGPPVKRETNKELYARMTEADKAYMRRLGGNPDDLLKEEDDKEDPNDAYMRKHGIDPDASAQS